jgi:hypothetical protein
MRLIIGVIILVLDIACAAYNIVTNHAAMAVFNSVSAIVVVCALPGLDYSDYENKSKKTVK